MSWARRRLFPARDSAKRPRSRKISPRFTAAIRSREVLNSSISAFRGLLRPGREGNLISMASSRRFPKPAPATLAKDAIKIASSNVPGLTNPPLNNFAPRISLAYSPTDKWVMRAGYGIYYAGFENIGGSPDIGSNYPFLYNFSFFNPDAGHS